MNRLQPGCRSPRMRGARALWIAAVAALAGCGGEPKETAVETGRDGGVEILLVGDPFAYAIERDLDYFSEKTGEPLFLNLRRYAKTLEDILRNRRDHESLFHLVAFDIVWLPQLAENQVLSPITPEDLAAMGVQPSDFYPVTYESNLWNGKLYGLPIQPHSELLFYRKDLLAGAGLEPPATFAELLEQARLFHDPANGFYGVCWNALRGQALGQTVGHLYAAFGQPLVAGDGKPRIDTPTGRMVLEFLLALKEVSPPDILSMAWDQRIDRFKRGKAAFTYGWGARSAMIESDAASEVAGRTGYIAPPAIRAGIPRIPFGQWSFGIPANLPDAERPDALRALAALLSPESLDRFAARGLESLHRRPPAPGGTPESAYGASARKLLESGLIHPDARPMTADWTELAEILGTVFHDVLLGRLDIDEGLAKAQSAADALPGSTGTKR